MPTKISGFADESLFFIFYTMTRDIMQVAVAEELYVTLACLMAFVLTICLETNVIGGIIKG